jgi:hypothetical protein
MAPEGRPGVAASVVPSHGPLTLQHPAGVPGPCWSVSERSLTWHVSECSLGGWVEVS